MSSDLEQTRRYEISDLRPPGVRMVIGDPRDLRAMLATGEIKAVGKFRHLPGGRVGIPAVYVTKRGKPFVVRHRIALSITGGVALMAAGIAWIIAAVGLGWLILGVALMAFAIATLSRYAKGGAGHRVTVTTTTTVRTK